MKSIIAGVLALITLGLLWWFVPHMLVGLFDANIKLIKMIAWIIPGQLGSMFEVAARGLGADHILVFFEVSMIYRLLLSLL